MSGSGSGFYNDRQIKNYNHRTEALEENEARWCIVIQIFNNPVDDG
jgi:hypothetical protein